MGIKFFWLAGLSGPIEGLLIGTQLVMLTRYRQLARHRLDNRGDGLWMLWREFPWCEN